MDIQLSLTQQPQDFRDFKFKIPWWLGLLKGFPALAHAFLPSKVDLRCNVLKVYHQGSLNACTANAAGALHQYLRFKQGGGRWDSSRLFIYYNARLLEGKTGQDSGTDLRTTMKAIAKFGVPPEELFPYESARFKDIPPQLIYDVAEKSQAVKYESVEGDLVSLKATLAQGFPFVFGMWVNRDFLSGVTARTGKLTDSAARVGQHAVMCVGYDHEEQHFICLNSFGPRWGDEGFFYVPYDFITRETKAFDFWVLRQVEQAET